MPVAPLDDAYVLSPRCPHPSLAQASAGGGQVCVRALLSGHHHALPRVEKGAPLAVAHDDRLADARAVVAVVQRVIHLQMNKAAQLYLLTYQLVWEDKQHQKFWAQFGESLLYVTASSLGGGGE
jgi:hypothetical protein